MRLRLPLKYVGKYVGKVKEVTQGIPVEISEALQYQVAAMISGLLLAQFTSRLAEKITSENYEGKSLGKISGKNL